MGNSVSCFDRVSEHPPYSWPRDHPDRERAIAERNERRRARRNNRLHQKAVRTGAKPDQVKPESAAPVQPNEPPKPASEPAQPDQQQQPAEAQPTVETTPQVEQHVPAPVAAVESPQKDAVQAELKDEQHVEAAAEAAVETAAEEQVENEIEHVQKEPKPLAEPSETTPEPLLVADTVDQTPETAAEPIVAEKELVEEVTEDALQKEPPTELETPVEQSAELAVEESKHADEQIEQAAEEAVPTDAPEGIIAVDSQEQEATKEEALTSMDAADTAAQETSHIKPVEEDEQVDKEAASPAPKVSEEEAAMLDAPEEALAATEAAKEDEMPSIDSRRAMFDRSEDQLPKPVDLRRDVLDPVTNEYITLEEYRTRQSERAQGLVKERLEKFEEIDDEISKEKAELAAIVAARSDAQKKSDWRYKQNEVKSPKLKSQTVKEVDSKVEELDRSVMAGSVAGLSAKFNDDGVAEEVDDMGEEGVSAVVKRMDFEDESVSDAVDSTAVTEEIVDTKDEVVDVVEGAATRGEVSGMKGGVEEQVATSAKAVEVVTETSVDAMDVEEEVVRIVESATGAAGKESLVEGNTTETAAAASATATATATTTTALPSS